jgi:glycerate 2-kinase
MRVLAAPDKFRGTLSASEAADAIRRGWLRSRPSDDVSAIAMADGGEGTLQALVSALRGETFAATVMGPLGDPVNAQYGVVQAPDGAIAVVEMARASGLGVLSPSRRDAVHATTFGTGELIRDALERHRPAAVLICIGGSATTDGGAGMAQALGARLLDRAGRDIGRGGGALLDLDRIDLGPMARLIAGTRFLVASDVDNPLVGPNGAAFVYGPQKGASADDVQVLDRALRHLAAVVHRDVGIDLRELPGGGAAGGLGAGLMAFAGAHIRPGVDVVMEAVGLADRLADADVVVTGEGRFDAQSLHGKTVAGVVRAAADAGVPAILVCGRAELRPNGLAVASLVERFGEREALENTRVRLESLVAELATSAPVEALTGR